MSSKKHLEPPLAHEATPAQGRIFLKSLKEEGIEDLYLDTPKKTATVSPPTPQPKILEKPNLAKEPAPSSSKDALIKLREEVLPCTKCSVLVQNRKSVVFGSGNVRASLMFVGEAPGRDEDLQGLPFVGAAGQLLTKIIESIGLKREQVFIANVLKCRPPNNRPPAIEEISNCEPYLLRQIEIIQPKIICCLGTFAAQTLLKTTTSISQLRGKIFPFGNAELRCTYHPAYLLRNPADKRKVWEDMKQIKAALEKIA